MTFNFKIHEVDLETLSKSRDLGASERSMLENEYAIQKAEKAILLENVNGDLLLEELNTLYYRIGFNTKTYWAGLHGAAANYICNLDGYVIPGWEIITEPFIKLFPQLKRTLLMRFSPGKRRYHIRLFQKSQNSWYFIAHVDILNWMIPTKKAYDSHHKQAQGDHVLGHLILQELMHEVVERVNKNRDLSEIDVDGIYQKLVSRYSIDKNRKFYLK